MITKVSYRPYAQGVNNTQKQQQKVNFGMKATDSEAVTQFAALVKAALTTARDPKASELASARRMTEALQALEKVNPRATMAEVLLVLKTVWRA